jgi:hypothetical protein
MSERVYDQTPAEVTAWWSGLTYREKLSIGRYYINRNEYRKLHTYTAPVQWWALLTPARRRSVHEQETRNG